MEYLFEVKNLSKSFVTNDGKALSILNDINFNLPSNGMFFIYGKSGCGKSTLLNIFEGLMKPSKGEIKYKGKTISKFSKKELNSYLKKDVGIIFQSFNLISDMTVKENLALNYKIKEIDPENNIEKYLEEYRLLDVKDKKVSSLSGGEKQRICLIRALANNPSVIFADEPTGNLDEANSYQLMNELKEISKSRLVIIVSHNKKLVNEFNDGYLDLTNGKQLFIEEIKSCSKEEKSEIINKKYKSPFFTYILNHNLKKDFFKNLIAIFSLIFSILVCFSFFGFNNGLEKNSSKLIAQFQNNNSYKVSKIVYEQKNDSNLTLEKTEKPKLSEINEIFNNYQNTDIHNSVDYFFGDTKETRINNELIKRVNYVPINNISASRLVVVNDAFENLYRKSHKGESLEGKTINLHLKRSYLYKNKSTKGSSLIKEDFIMYIPFYVNKINEEFTYLNYPKVYFSIDYFENILKEHFCNNIFKETGIKHSYFSLLDEAAKNSELGNYSYQIFLDNYDEVADFNGKIEKLKKFKIINEPYTTVKSFKELSSSLFDGLVLFIVIVVISSIALISFLSYSTFVFNRKQSAILTILGAENDEICLIYIFEQIIVTIMSILFAFLSYPLIQKLLNWRIKINTRFDDLILIPNDPKLKILFALLVVGLVFICVCVPLLFSKKNEIYKELKEE